MSLITEGFLLFAVILVAVYFIVPKRWRWTVLLLFSLAFYCTAGVKSIIYVLFTAFSAWLCAQVMDKIHASARAYVKANKDTLPREQRTAYKKRKNNICKLLMALTVLANVGILCVFKYSDFVLSQFDSSHTTLGLVVPLGISFYTFQTVGYVVDVYWEKTEAQPNFLKMLLYVSFFPQVTQGPISDYSYLAPQLFEGHAFSYDGFMRGSQRMLWGFFKKTVIADRAAPFVETAFAEYASMNGINVLFGAFLYSLQIYADFSGYMDIVCGLCEILGIRLTENFERPYFSKSVAEYWRRWHISLGTWFKTYLYYPIAVSRFAKNTAKLGSRALGKTFGKTVAASLALVVVWFTTGFWHGASWAYIAWGGLNGVFIILALWLEPTFTKIKAALRIKEQGFAWRAFATLRTFFVVTMIKVFPEVGDFSDGVGYWLHCFSGWRLPDSFEALIYPVADAEAFYVLAVGALLMFVVSLLQRRRSVRDRLARLWLPVRILIFALIFIAIVWYGVPTQSEGGGFLYAQF